MRPSIEMFGIKIDVPAREKRKYKKRGKSKAPASPQKDKMVKEPSVSK